LRRLVGAAALALLLVAVGCKSKDGGGGGSGSLTKNNNDPLVMGPGRIPKQNIPIPDRGTAGKDRDPLLGSPAGRAGDNKTGASYNSDPERWKNGPFIPSTASTPAALAGRPRDDEGLKIESPGGVRPAGGTTTAGATRDTDGLIAELQKYGVKRGDYSFDRDGGNAIFRARVPIGDDRVREYTGQGPTPADAVRQVLEQVKSDRW
jgi:hypothetical protein